LLELAQRQRDAWSGEQDVRETVGENRIANKNDGYNGDRNGYLTNDGRETVEMRWNMM
jgi:hypothetical protein